jgi:diacylglycerol kinase (ATP)
MGKPQNTGIRRIALATRYSVRGIRAAWIHEAAFRQELLLAFALTPAAIWLGRSALEVSVLIGVCLLVLVIELLNSAVETTIDRIGPERHELSGRAKDVGSAAVFIALTIVVLVWASVLWDRFS